MATFRCTKEDLLVFAANAVPCAYIVYGYLVYGQRTKKAPVYSREERRHQYELTVVFVVCGILHAFNKILIWFFPLHYVTAAIYSFHAYRVHRLNASKVQLTAYQHGQESKDFKDAIEARAECDPELSKTLKQVRQGFTAAADQLRQKTEDSTQCS